MERNNAVDSGFHAGIDGFFSLGGWGIPWEIYISSEMQLDSERFIYQQCKEHIIQKLVPIKVKKVK